MSKSNLIYESTFICHQCPKDSDSFTSFIIRADSKGVETEAFARELAFWEDRVAIHQNMHLLEKVIYGQVK